VEGGIRSEQPRHPGISFDHGLQVVKASWLVPVGRVDVEIAVREQELDPFEGLDPLGEATVAPIHTAQRVERLGEGTAIARRRSALNAAGSVGVNHPVQIPPGISSGAMNLPASCRQTSPERL
jgi:hypothetical protein